MTVLGSVGSLLNSRIPVDATHLVISVGGNDALANIDLLATPVRSTAEALALFESRLDPFEREYREAIEAARARGLPLTLCTLRVAFEHQLSVIDLRMVCSEPEDYANPIEPSGRGGGKIAAVIVDSLNAAKASRVFTASIKAAAERARAKDG